MEDYEDRAELLVSIGDKSSRPFVVCIRNPIRTGIVFVAYQPRDVLLDVASLKAYLYDSVDLATEGVAATLFEDLLDLLDPEGLRVVMEGWLSPDGERSTWIAMSWANAQAITLEEEMRHALGR